MIIGNVFSKNSNGEKTLKLKGVKFSSRSELEKYETEKTEKTGFDHEVEIVREEKSGSGVEINKKTGNLKTKNVTIDETVSVENYDFDEEYDKKDFPAGWWVRNEFVAKDGTVFKRGKKQPDLYRTKLPDEYEILKDE